MNYKTIATILSVNLLIGSTLFAMPPLEGNWEPDYPPGVNSPDRGFAARDDADFEGEWQCLIILVDFEDYPWDNQEDENFPNEDRIYTQEHFEDMLFSVGDYQHPGAESEFTGSMRDYYLEISGGVFETIGTATRWYRAPEPLTYYCNNDGEEGTEDDYGFGQYPNNAQKLVEDVLELADEDVDFSLFDNDENGHIDGLFVVHAGPGAEATGQNPNYIWSHKWQINPQERDSVTISVYSMEPEDGAIGVFCHEFGHVLGLPDLYDTDYSSQGIGDWGVMSGGSWGHRAGDPPGSSPVHMCGWSKLQLDWADLRNIEDIAENVEIPPVTDGNIIYRLWTSGEDSPEYFLVEHRRQIGFDASITTRQIRGGLAAPEGLLITHIDDDMWSNDNELHRLVDIEEASPIYIDGRPRENLDGNLRDYGPNNLYNPHRGDNGDLWPGFSEHNEDSTEWTGDRDRTRFGTFTTPSSYDYNGRPSLVEVYDIRLEDENVICSFAVDAIDQPFVVISEHRTSDEEGGNANGLIEPGETIELFVQLENVGGKDASDVEISLEYEGGYAEVLDGVSNLEEIEAGQSVELESPFVFEVFEDTPMWTLLEFTLTIAEEDYEFIYPLGLEVRPPHEWYKYPENPVLTGAEGEWNADGAFSPAVLVEGDTIKCWYVSSSVEGEPPVPGAIGLAWSIDGGVSWEELEEPVLSPDPDIDWMWAFTGIGIMPIGENGYLMAFMAITEDSTASIGLAHSINGLAWTVDEEPVINSGDGWMVELFQLGQLAIFPFGDQTGLAFQGTNAIGLPQIGFAFSEDMDTWKINNELILMPTMNAMDFDGYALVSPEIVPSGDNYEILYAGLGGNFAFSLGVAFTDGENITRHRGLEAGGAVLEPGGVGSWGEIYLVGGRHFNWGEERRMIFCGLDEGNISALGLASQYPYLSAPEFDKQQVHVPNIIMLDPAYPNPFNSSTTIRYNLTRDGLVQVKIYDITGREVTRLVEGYHSIGQHSIVWNGRNGAGKSVSSGLYFVKVCAFGQSANTKTLLIK